MSNETMLTIIGTLTADPELRFTPSGVAVANFTLANNPRHFDKASGNWKDGDALFMRCAIWRDAAENLTNSLSRGDRVIASGRLIQKSYETQSGEKRTSVELAVDEIGPSLKWASVKVVKASRSGAGTTPGSTGGAQDDDEPPF